MRKITCLFALFLAFCLTAVAEDFVPVEGAKYLIRNKGNQNFALHNADCVLSASDNTVILSAWSQFDERSFFVIEGSAQNGYTIRMANDENNYVYAINTGDANSNVGVKAVEGTVTDDCKWRIVQNDDGWNIIPQGGSNSWNVRGSYNNNLHIGQWSDNTKDDNRWFILTASELVAADIETAIGLPPFSAATKTAANVAEENLTEENADALCSAWAAEKDGELVKPTSASGLFKIKNNSLGKYLFQENDAKGITFMNDGGDNSKYYWKVSFDGNQATITSSVGTALARGGSGQSYTNATKTEASPVTLQSGLHMGVYVGGGYFLFPNTHSTDQSIYTKNYADYNSEDNPYFLTTWATTAEANQYVFEEVTLAEGASVYTVNITTNPDGTTPTVVTYNGEGYTGNASVQNGGFFVFSSTPDAAQFESVVGAFEGTIEVNETEKTINVVSYTANRPGYDAEGNLSFESGYYYMVGVDATRRNKLFNDHTRAANTNDLTLQSATQGTTNNYIWKIDVNGDNTVTIKNGQGTPIATDANKYSTLTIGDYVAGYEGIYFTEALNCTNGGYTLTDGSHYLVNWTDGGAEAIDNRWNFEPVAEASSFYSVAIHGMDDTYVTRTATGEIALNGGFFLSTTTPAAGEFTPLAQDGYSSRVSVDATNKVITVNYVKLPVAGQFYRLKGDYSGNYVVAATAGSQIPMEARSESNDATTIYYLDTNKLLNYSTGLYIYNTREAGNVGQANTWTFAASASSVGALTLTANRTTSGIGLVMYDNDNRVDRYGSELKPYTNWYVEAVSSLPVSISAAGYATLIAPVALLIPADVKAYTATLDDTKAVLTELTEGVIPANTGVVLEGNEGTYNFEITTTEATATSALTGQPQTVNAAAETTVFALGNKDGKVAFYRLEDGDGADRTIKGMRAYFVAETPAQAISLDFGAVTGIDGTTVTTPNNANAPIYDLSGRRVMKAQQGIYIQNGRKIYVK